ncbi:MAG: PEP-CTERM sorting domain-containing protein, partial [Cyanobacteriota bacterium]
MTNANLLKKLPMATTLKTTGISLASLAAVLSTTPSYAASFTFNPTNTQTIGSVTTSNGEAFLNSSGASDFQIEQFLGLNAGSLDAVQGKNATNGSALKTTIAAKAGDVFSFDWKFKAGDGLPYNDFSFFSIGSVIQKLGDVASSGGYGGEAGANTTYTFTADGIYTVGYGVLNLLDTVAASKLKISNVAYTETAPVPEPASVLGLLAFGAMGAGSLKRKQQQKVAV